MGNHTDGLAVADHFLEGILDGPLSQIISPLLGGFSESLLLACVPLDSKNERKNGYAIHRKRQNREGSSSDTRPSGESFLKPCSPELPTGVKKLA